MSSDHSTAQVKSAEVERVLARTVIGLSGAAATAVAILLFVGWQPIVELLPFASTTLTNQFVGSVALAYAAAALWIAWSGEIAAFAGAGLTIIAVSAGAAAGHITASPLRMIDVAVALGAVAAIVMSVVLSLWTARLPVSRPAADAPVRAPGLRGLHGHPGCGRASDRARASQRAPMAPCGEWPGARRLDLPCRRALFRLRSTPAAMGNAVGRLLAFLAYDMALIVPMLIHFGNVDAAQSLSLVGYVAVLVVSGAIAIYAFTMDPRTRLGSRDIERDRERTTASPAA